MSVAGLWPLPVILLPVLAYARGPSASGGRLAAFAIGWMLAVLSLSGAADDIAERSFFLHMVAHAVLMGVAAPLLVLARPLPRRKWGLPRPDRAGDRHLPAGRGARRLAPADPVRRRPRRPPDPRPPAPDAARHQPPVLAGHRRGASERGAAGPCGRLLFLASVLGTLLGFLLTLASGFWYTPVDAPICGLSPLADQQLGGLVVWVLPAGLVYVAAGLGLLARWIKGSAASAAWTPEQG